MNNDAYELMLRHVVRDQCLERNVETKDFDANRVKLNDEQLAEAAKRYDDALPEVASDILEAVCLHLKDPKNSFAMWFHSPQEAIGVALVAGLRDRLTRRVKLDLVCKAGEIEMEDAVDNIYAEDHT